MLIESTAYLRGRGGSRQHKAHAFPIHLLCLCEQAQLQTILAWTLLTPASRPDPIKIWKVLSTAVQPRISRVNDQFSSWEWLGIAIRRCCQQILPARLVGQLERNANSILLDAGFRFSVGKLHGDGICVKQQHAAISNHWLEAELSHRRVDVF